MDSRRHQRRHPRGQEGIPAGYQTMQVQLERQIESRRQTRKIVEEAIRRTLAERATPVDIAKEDELLDTIITKGEGDLDV
jgi:hypothetical protein